MAIDSANISGSNTTVYTSSGNNAVTCMWVCNVDSVQTANLTLHFVKNGDPITNTNMVIKELPVPPLETVVFDAEKIILDNGDRIVASANGLAGVLTTTISTIQV
jgi:hypothetical protein